ncbi:MAG: hypothetical protein HUU21_32230 [Polyangiaceae bacterium]|nr:hypothetical protein [Polyangiaceae bacterium]
MSQSTPPAEPVPVHPDLDEDGEISPESLRELHAAIARSEEEIARGETIPAEDVLAWLKSEDDLD